MIEIAPKFTGGKSTITLDGALFAWNRSDAQPVFLAMPGSELDYIACFSTPAKLRAFHTRAGAPFDSIKLIEDGMEFLASIAVAPRIAVIVDPWFTLEGRVRYAQVYP